MTTLDSSKEIQKNNSEDNEKHEDFRMFGLITFLIADGMTFAGFFAAYLTYKAVNPLPDGAIYELELPIPTLNTILLLVSSATFHKAGKALLKDKNSDSQRWLFFTAFLGIIFLICQLFEYFHLPFGLTDNLFASTFYALTGFLQFLWLNSLDIVNIAMRPPSSNNQRFLYLEEVVDLN